jgi:integrase
MTYTFARVSAAHQMKVRDYFVQGRRSWMAPHEKGGKEHQVSCHHNLEKYLDEYIAAAGIKTPRVGNHSLRATGITAYLKNKGLLEHAQTLANHASPRTTKLYDRRQDEILSEEVEKISI